MFSFSNVVASKIGGYERTRERYLLDFSASVASLILV